MEWAFTEVEPGLPVLEVHEAQRRVESGVLTDDRQPVVQEPDRVVDRVPPPSPSFLSRLQVALVRMQVADWTFGEATVFVSGELELEGLDDDAGEPFLEREDVLDAPVEVVGPQVMVRAQLR